MSLYEATGGPGWRTRTNWLTDAPLEDWHGVVTDGAGSVSNLTLERNNLKGAIPAELGDLSELRTISLAFNFLEGPIPPETGRLSRLESIALDGNGLTGPIPSEFGELANLRQATLSRNRLSGPLPASLLRLARLSEFVFEENDGLCAPGATGFVAWLAGIQVADGPYCNRTDKAVLEAMYELAGGSDWTNSAGWLAGAVLGSWHGISADSLGRVTAIDLSGNGLDGRLPPPLGQLAQMTELRVDGNPRLAGRLPESLTALSLTTLAYAGTGLCTPMGGAFRSWLETVGSHEGTSQECDAITDREALDAIYHALGGPGWTIGSNWLTSAPMGDWHGVTTDGEGRVTRLELAFNGLEGEIPPETGGLARLQALDLSYNALTGDVPPSIGDLAGLAELYLQHNELGTIPSEAGAFPGILFLDVSYNRLAGEIPAGLTGLATLADLNLAGNDFTGAIPAEVGRMTSLLRLALADNELAGPIPREIGGLANLSMLNLANNELTGPIPQEIGGLANLMTLDLAGNELTGAIPPELGRLAQLYDLGLGSNRLSGNVPPEIAGLAGLSFLRLSHNAELSGALPGDLTALAGLREFMAEGTMLCAPADPAFQRWLAGVVKRRIPMCRDTGSSSAYLVQAVQSLDFPVPLVAGEPALLRVFVSASGASDVRMPPARARFYQGGSEVRVVNIPAPEGTIPDTVSQGMLALSANAEIPGSLIQPGLEMVVEIDPDGALDSSLDIAKRIPEEGRLEIEVQALPLLDFTLIPFLVGARPDSSILEITGGLAPEDALLRDIKTLLPVPGIDLEIHEPVITSSADFFALVEEVSAIRIVEGATGHYMGLTTGSSGGVVGLADTPGRASVSIPRSDVMAHELGHNLNLYHAPCGRPGGPDPSFPSSDGSIGAWGYDFRDSSLVAPTVPDVMGYCDPPIWISDFHFTNALRFRADVESRVPGGSATKSLLLWGGADADGVPFLAPAFVTDAAPTAPPPGGGEYDLAGRSASGEVIFSLSFDLPALADGDGRSAFAFALPVREGWAGALASITISGPGGSFALDGESDRAAAIVRDPLTGRVRAIFRDAPPGILAAAAMAAPLGREAAAALSLEPGLDVFASRGLPSPRDWRR